MYNRILKRPMFRRGGSSFQSQGTGITSPFDTPRRGLVQHPGGYAGKTLEELAIEKEEIFAPKKGEWLNEVIGSFGAYGDPYKESGEAKTIGEMGYAQAEGLAALRKEKEEKRQLAALSNIETQEAAIAKALEEAEALKRTKANIRPLEVDAKKKLVAEARDMLKQAKIDYADKVKYPNGIPQHIIDEIDALNTLALGDHYWTIARAATHANEVYSTKAVLEGMLPVQIKAAIKELIAKLTGNRYAIKAEGGRVGLYNSYPGTVGNAAEITETETISPTGAVEASTTEIANDTINHPNEGAGLGLGEGDEAYQLLRARLPQEITDDIVRLIAYNPSAFQDFANIETQEDVIAFNNKYGVELVIDAPQV
jgi:hypothetical protein